jgi:hypothetical protein
VSEIGAFELLASYYRYSFLRSSYRSDPAIAGFGGHFMQRLAGRIGNQPDLTGEVPSAVGKADGHQVVLFDAGRAGKPEWESK